MRLIDADEIKLEKGFFDNINNVPKFFEWLGKQPTIELVKHGRWVDATKEIGWPVWKCSVCGRDGRGDYFVCPWCGAKMSEAEK